MNESIESEIVRCEEQLRSAMLHSDLSMLDALLKDELLFTNHFGQVMSKQDDLNAHRSGLFTITSITLSDQRMKVAGNSVIVSVLAHIVGEYKGKTSDNHIRFTRIWTKNSSAHWQVIAGHASELIAV